MAEREGNSHKAHAEAYLRKAGYTAEPKTGGEDYMRRNGPVDIELEAAKSPSTRAANTDGGAAHDYRQNLQRTGSKDAADSPNRKRSINN